jgi:hypothetical protein
MKFYAIALLFSMNSFVAIAQQKVVATQKIGIRAIKPGEVTQSKAPTIKKIKLSSSGGPSSGGPIVNAACAPGYQSYGTVECQKVAADGKICYYPINGSVEEVRCDGVPL